MAGAGGLFLALWGVSDGEARLRLFLCVSGLVVIFRRARFCVWASGLDLVYLVRWWIQVEVEGRMQEGKKL